MAETGCIYFDLVIWKLVAFICWVCNLVVKDWIYRFDVSLILNL